MQRSSSSLPAVAGLADRSLARVRISGPRRAAVLAIAAAGALLTSNASAGTSLLLQSSPLLGGGLGNGSLIDPGSSLLTRGGLNAPRSTFVGNSNGLEATLAWNGTTGNWNDTTKWSTGTVPVAGDIANFATNAAGYTTTNNLPTPLIDLAEVNVSLSGAGTTTFAGGFKSARIRFGAAAGQAPKTNLTSGDYLIGTAAGTTAGTNDLYLRRDSVTNVNTGAVLKEGTTDAIVFQWENGITNINAGGTADFRFDTWYWNIDDNSALNVNAGATANIDWIAVSNDVLAGTRKLKVSGTGAVLNSVGALVSQLDLFGTGVGGNATIDVNAGGTYNAGRAYLNDATAGTTLATTTLTVSDGTFNVKDSNAGANSFLVSGNGGVGTTTIAVNSGGVIDVSDSGTGEFGYSALGNAAGATTVVTVGGTNGTGGRSKFISEDAVFINGGDGTLFDTTTATITVTDGGDFGTSAAGFIQTSADALSTTTLNVSGNGTIDAGGQFSLNGGNQGTNPASPTDFGAGITNINVTAGGTVRADVLEVMADPAAFDTEGGVTNITVDGAGSQFLVDGTDNPATTTLESGFLLTSFGITDALDVFIPGSDTGKYGKVNYTVTNGGLFDVNEVAFAGDLQEGTTTVAVSGVGSKFDAGGGLIVNSAGLANSNVAITVTGGGEVVASTDSSGALGGIVLNGTAGSGTLTVDVTGAGSTLRSSDIVFIGGTAFENTTTGDLDLVAGTPATVTTGAGTNFIAGGNVYVAAGSSLVTGGRYEALNTIVSGSWTINGGNASRIVDAGGLFLDGATSSVVVTPTAATTPILVRTGNIDVPVGASIELHKNAMQITPFGSPATTIADVKAYITANAIKSADLTATTGIGIALVTAPGTFLGSPTAAGDILVRYTLSGDADLSGNVNFDDLLKLAANYNQTGQYWYQGDFNNDGTVNFDDLLKLAANYNQTLTGSLGGDWALAQSAVPEPTSLLAIGLGGAAILGRRRRR